MKNLTCKERFEQAADLKEPDRVPAAYIYHGASRATLKALNFTWNDIYYSEKNAFDSILLAHRMWNHDNVCSILSPTCGIDDLGLQVTIPDYEEPFVDFKTPFIMDESDLDKITIPDPFKSMTMSKTVRTATLLRKKLGPEIPIVGGFGGISTWAFFLRRADNFVKDFVKNKRLQAHYLELITNIAIDFCVAQIKGGCDWIISGEDAFAVDLFGPDQSWECNGIYAKRLAKAIHDEGGRYIIHCCGDSGKALNKMVDTEADIVSVDRVNLNYAKKTIGSRVALMGNVKSSILLGKKTLDVEKDCIRAMNEAKESGGYFLSCGYIYPSATPSENVKALTDATRIHGKY